LLDSYIAGLILLAAAPCTAMVFVWSSPSGGDSVELFTARRREDINHSAGYSISSM